MNASKTSMGLLDTSVRWMAGVLLAYWGIFALLTPVTVWDSHVYNLARLPIARLEGLFGNTLFLNIRQIMFPWSFDSIHLPFLALEWGYALPSYLSLIGIAWILFKMLQRTAGARTAWLGVISLFALPTVIFQATSTKNDLGLVFVALFACYSLFRYLELSSWYWLLLSAIAVGFLPGIKSTGFPLAFFVTLATVWLLRRDIRLLASWCVAAGVSFCLLGSLEIYLNNAQLYSNPLGEPAVALAHSNQDGPAGGLANLIRYVFGFINPGWVRSAAIDANWSQSLEVACRAVLEALHLTDLGFHSYFSDSTVSFRQGGDETSSDFGPFGMAAMAISAWRVIRFRKAQPACWVALAGWFLLVVSASTVAWMPWNMRFLMLPAILFVAATLMTLAPHIEQKPWVFIGVFLMLLYSVIAFPVASTNKRPKDLIDAVQDREMQTLGERRAMRPVFDAVRELSSASPGVPWLLHTGGDSWTLGLLEMRAADVMPAPELDARVLNAASAKSDSGAV
ncbi:MAG: glycosyltransferase family 39 protein, partial [Arenicellales bacterium]